MEQFIIPRVIVHVDMDYFYAAIEEREDPSLRGKAVVVCMYSNRGESSGAVSTSNYLARETGIRSAMPCKIARSKNPDAVFLPVRKQLYEQVSEKVMTILRSNADNEEGFEKVSIDEAFIEITESCKNYYDIAKDMGIRIKEEIKANENITCSVGIAPNKLIAKMASSFQKPDGITVVRPNDVKDFLKPMPVKKLWGIGKVTEEKLYEIGIRTVSELASCDVMELISSFGKSKGMWLKNAANGEDPTPLKGRKGADQIGRMASLEHDSRNESMIFLLLNELIGDVIVKAEARKVYFRSMTVTVIFSDFKTSTKSRTLSHAVCDRNILMETAKEIMNKFLEESAMNFRRIGIRVEDLQESTGQKNIFDF